MDPLLILSHYLAAQPPGPVLDLNSFCPTGPGGGVDPTCSPGSTRSAPNGREVLASAEGPDGITVHISMDVDSHGHHEIFATKKGWPGTARLGNWSDWPESHWGLTEHEYRAKPDHERAGLQAREVADNYAGKQFYDHWLEDNHPDVHEKEGIRWSSPERARKVAMKVYRRSRKGNAD
jgi:hypothetical protein